MNRHTVHWRSELPEPFRDIRTLRALYGFVLDDGESGEGGEVAQALGAELTNELRKLIHGAMERYLDNRVVRAIGLRASDVADAARALECHGRGFADLLDGYDAAIDLTTADPVARVRAARAAEYVVASVLARGSLSLDPETDRDALARMARVARRLADGAAALQGHIEPEGRGHPRRFDLDFFLDDLIGIWMAAGRWPPARSAYEAVQAALLGFGRFLLRQVGLPPSAVKRDGEGLRDRLEARFSAAE